MIPLSEKENWPLLPGISEKKKPPGKPKGGDMDIKNFIYLIEVATTGSITKAASKLYLSQPNLSKIIREMEEEFKLKIFMRTRNGVSLTPLGEKFIYHAKLLVKEYEKFGNLEGGISPLRESFSIASIRSSLVFESFIRLVKEYEDRGIEFTIRESSGLEPLQDIYRLHADLGVIYFRSSHKDKFLSELKRKGVAYQRVNTFSPCVIVRRGHPLCDKKQPLRLDDLQGLGFVKYNHDVIAYEENETENLYTHLLSSLQPKNIVHIFERGAFHNLLTQTDFFSFGIMSAQNQEEWFGIVSIPFEAKTPDIRLEMGLIYLKTIKLSPIAQRFIKILMDTYREKGPSA